MGMRRNIAFTFDNAEKPQIYLYTHWGADGMEQRLAIALDNDRGRWNDPSYLARYIVSNVLEASDHEDDTGHGLAPYEVDPEFPTLHVDLEAQTVNGVGYEEFITNPHMFKI